MNTHIDCLDGLNETLSKAQALSYMTWGESGEKFRGMCDEMQDVYMWALSDLIKEASKHLVQLQEQLEAQKGGSQ